jgi:hypothetical protein
VQLLLQSAYHKVAAHYFWGDEKRDLKRVKQTKYTNYQQEAFIDSGVSVYAAASQTFLDGSNIASPIDDDYICRTVYPLKRPLPRNH